MKALNSWYVYEQCDRNYQSKVWGISRHSFFFSITLFILNSDAAFTPSYFVVCVFVCVWSSVMSQCMSFVQRLWLWCAGPVVVLNQTISLQYQPPFCLSAWPRQQQHTPKLCVRLCLLTHYLVHQIMHATIATISSSRSSSCSMAIPDSTLICAGITWGKIARKVPSV